jgi:uncharacterized protein
MTAEPFWKTKKLTEMTTKEWESLCDGCGKCCLMKYEDDETNELHFTSIACKLLDDATCRCSDYKNRMEKVDICVKLTPKVVATVDWLPDSCAYRLVHEGKDLYDWHHLKSGNPELVHKHGFSARDRTVSEEVVPEEDVMEYVIDWFHGPPKRRRARKRRK